jgi:hypothetical protein
MGGMFRNTRARILGSQTRNVYFLEIGSTGRPDVIGVRYSATNSRVPSNSRVRFQGNVVRVNCL